MLFSSFCWELDDDDDVICGILGDVFMVEDDEEDDDVDEKVNEGSGGIGLEIDVLVE